MKKEELLSPIREKYSQLKEALKGTDLGEIRALALEVHGMVHPAEMMEGTFGDRKSVV